MSGSVPGMNYPQIKPMVASTPSDSAIASLKTQNSLQNARNHALSGGKKSKKSKKSKKNKYRKSKKSKKSKKNKRGGGSGISVPQFTQSYTPAGTVSTNDIIKSHSQVSTQATANAKYDCYATKTC
jgi:hypothetical protein